MQTQPTSDYPVIGCDVKYCPKCDQVLSFDASGHPICRNCHSKTKAKYIPVALFERRYHDETGWEVITEEQATIGLTGSFTDPQKAIKFLKTGERIKTAAATYRHRRIFPR